MRGLIREPAPRSAKRSQQKTPSCKSENETAARKGGDENYEIKRGAFWPEAACFTAAMKENDFFGTQQLFRN